MAMAQGELTMMMIAINLLSLMVTVTAQAPSPTPAAAAPSPPITCTLPNSLMVSSNFCNALDQQSMQTQTQQCNDFLTDIVPAPSKDCCTGLNEVAYNRTACICMITFYPSSSHNASRQLDLPRLCSVQTDLCSKCPAFLISRSNGTSSASPTYVPYEERKSMASTIGAITLAVVFGLLLLGGIIGLTLTIIKKRRAKNNPPRPFEATPPGGAF